MVRSTLGVPVIRASSRRDLTIHRAMAGVMLAQWFLLMACAVSERLHRAVCDGAQQQSHDCAVVTLAKGQLSAGTGSVTAPVPRSQEIVLAWVTPEVLLSSVDLRLMPDRGPPFFFLPT